MLWPVSFGENWYSKMYAGHSLSGRIELEKTVRRSLWYEVVFTPCITRGPLVADGCLTERGIAAMLQWALALYKVLI